MRMNEIKGTKKGYQAYELDGASRTALARKFPPKFTDFIGHHITYAFGVSVIDPLPEPADIKVVGYAYNEQGIEALVVEVNGTTTRPDGKTFHITWSLDRDGGFKPVHSNNLIADSGYEALTTPINITATPKFF